MADQSSHASHDLVRDNAPVSEQSPRAPNGSLPGSGAALTIPHRTTDEAGSAAELVEAGGSNNGAGRESGEILLSPEAQKTVISRNRPEGSSSLPPLINPLEMAVMLEGQRLGHFQLGQFVGGGGMGAVFRATDTLLDRTVAVKILSRNHCDEEIIRRFKNEAQSAARLDHPNIARVYFVGEDQGWNYIVFEFIEGVNIRDLVDGKGPLSLEEAFSFTLQVAEALEHACNRDVVHRDIKPSNILIMPDGRVKLVDMGLARLHQVEAGDNDLTASGMTLGTFDYISPEQARDPRSADVRSDLYSLGCTLYYMLTGRPPFAGTAIKKLLSHAGDSPPNVRQFRADVPDEVAALVNRMMAKRAEDRFQRPSELIGEMLLLADQLGLSGATRGGTVWITKQTSPLERFTPLLVTLASILLLAGAVFALDRLMAQTDTTSQARGTIQLEEPLPQPPVGPSTAVQGASDTVGGNTAGGNTVGESPGVTPSQAADTGSPGSIPPTTSVAPDGGAEPAPPISPLPSGPPAPSAFAEFFGPLESDALTFSDVPAVLDLRPEEAELGFLSGSADDSEALLSAVEPVTAEIVSEPLPELVVIGSDPQEALPPRAIALGSLEQALKYAAETPTVATIELAGGVYELDPLTIAFKRAETDRDELLTIRARGESAPVLVFRPRADELDPQTQMIRVIGGRHIHWDDLHFWLELPDEVAAEPWSLFHLQNLASLTFNNCTMTIDNADADGRVLHDETAFIAVESPVVAPGGFSPGPVFIGLQSCIARGQAALVRAETATPFSLNWTEGVFVSSERMVEAGGRADQPGESDRIEVDLQNITAVLPHGLCRLATGVDKKHQLILDVNCARNIFLCDSGAVLLERQGPEKPDDVIRTKLLYNDSESFFPRQAPLFCRIGSDLAETHEYRFREAAEMFMTVKPPKEFVMWKRGDPATDAPAHKARKEDFLLDDAPQMANAGGFRAGFNPASLPLLPLAPSASPMPAPESTPVEGME